MTNNEMLLTALATVTTSLCPMYHQIELYFDSKEFIKENKKIKRPKER